MLEVLATLFPVFALGLVGFAAARLSAFPPGAMEGMNRFIFDIAAPVTVIRVLASAELPQRVPWGLLASFYLPLFTIYFTALCIARRARIHPTEAVMMGFGASYGNLVLVGLPVMLLVFGEPALVPYFILLPLHGVSLMTVTAVLVEASRHGAGADRHAVARQVLMNPFVVGVGGGVLLRSQGIVLSGPIDEVAAVLQQALTPCALFSLGVSLAERGFKGHLRTSALLVLSKNVVLPLAVYLLAAHVFDLRPLWTAVVVLTAAQPIGVLFFVFAARFRTSAAMAASAVSMSTLFTLVSLPVIVWWLRMRGLVD